jgi:hypothetical protein
MKAPVSCSVLLLLTILCPSLAATASPKLQPVAFWSFNRCAMDGSRILDSSPGRHDLTVNGGFCSSGRYDLALKFDGVDDIAETRSDVLNFKDKLSISAWVYPEMLFGPQTIVNKWYAMDSYMLSLQDGEFAFTLAFQGGRWGTTISVTAPARLNAWNHVAAVFDGQTATIYVDGLYRDSVRTPGRHLQKSARPVAVGNHPSWNAFQGRIDELGLYDAALTEEQVKSLAGTNESPYFGADTSANPGRKGLRFPDGEENGYDIYLGSVGWVGWTCTVRDEKAKAVVSWEAEDAPNCCYDKKKPCGTREEFDKCPCLFTYEAATIARPERTYAFSWVLGPGRRGSFEPLEWGEEQARFLLARWRNYRHLIGGHTLFGDVERSRTAPDSSGWGVCPPYNTDAQACQDNRAVLEGFLRTVADSPISLTPGVYTRSDVWLEFFGEQYRPMARSGGFQPFVLWLTGCGTTSGCGNERTPSDVASALPFAEDTVLGGMRTVIWQNHINCADFDATSQSPSGTFTVTPEPSGVRYRSCSLP